MGGLAANTGIIGASLGNRKGTASLPSSIISSPSSHLPRPFHPMNHFLPTARYCPQYTITTVEGSADQRLAQSACSKSVRPSLASCEILGRGCNLSGLSFLICKARLKITNNNKNNNKLSFSTKLFTHSTNTYKYLQTQLVNMIKTLSPPPQGLVSIQEEQSANKEINKI